MLGDLGRGMKRFATGYGSDEEMEERRSAFFAELDDIEEDFDQNPENYFFSDWDSKRAQFKNILGLKFIMSSKNIYDIKKGLVFASILLSFSCFSQQTINGTIVHDGIVRSYRLYVPSIYTGNMAVPLLFNCYRKYSAFEICSSS